MKILNFTNTVSNISLKKGLFYNYFPYFIALSQKEYIFNMLFNHELET